MQGTDRYLRMGRVLCSLILLAAAAFYVVDTIHWRWMHDESIMRYVNFLMAHGKAPYRDIIDPNMPGSFFIDGWASRLFGAGDLGVRLYEFTLLGSLIAAMMVIAQPYDWFGGLFAGVLFLLIHACDGPLNAVERDEIMTVLIMVGYAFLFLALRQARPWLLMPFGFLVGLAASLKPTAAPLGLVLLAMVAVVLRKQKVPAASYLSSGIGGLLAAFAVTVSFLIEKHVLGDFLAISKRLLPYYAAMGNLPQLDLLRNLPIRAVIVLLPIALVLTLVNTDWKNWERWALALGTGFGAVSYFVQRKGFIHHRYPLFAFLLLWMGIEFARAVKRTGWIRVLGLAGVAIGVFYVVPAYAVRLKAVQTTAHLPDMLETDLTRLGGARLQNQVQCLDMVSGCLTALYRLGVVQSTGYMGDYMFFPPSGTAVASYDRDAFWNDIHRNPPKVIVVTNQWLMRGNTFDKLKQWPELMAYLLSDYTLNVTRDFGPQEWNLAYRIYVRNAGPDYPCASSFAR